MSGRFLSQFTLAFILGILSSFYTSLIFLILCSLFQLIQGYYLISVYGKKIRSMLIIRAVFCCTALLIGYFHCKTAMQLLKQNETLANNYRQITISGKIDQKESQKQNKSREQNNSKADQQIYHLKQCRIHLNNQTYPTNKILVYATDHAYVIGNTIRVTGNIIPFKTARNEGNFDEKQYNISKNIGFKLDAKEIILIENKQNKYKLFLSNFREKLFQIYQTVLPEKEAGFFSAAILGKKSFLDPDMKKLYQQAGISHILAISGLHVSLLGMGIYHVLIKLKRHSITAGIFAAVTAGSFCILSGMEISTTRAAMMFLIMMLGKTTGRSYDSITALSAAALLQLWQNPYYLFNTGFLFSYIAVLGVVVVAKCFHKSPSGRSALRRNGMMSLGRIAAGGESRMRDSFAIQLCILPLSVYYYFEFSLYSIGINTLILPFVGILLCLGILGGMAGIFSLQLAFYLLYLCRLILRGYELICGFFLRLPGAVWVTGKPSFAAILIYYCVFVLIIIYIFFKRKRRIFLLFMLPAFLLLGTGKQTTFEITFLDVSQGDGIFIQTEKGRAFLIDGGSSDVSAVGEYRILPFLKARKIRQIEGWFVSHGDADHTAGLFELLELGFPIKTILLPAGMVRDEIYDQLIYAARKGGSKILHLKEGESLQSDRLSFTCLYPPAENANPDRNQSSMVILLSRHQFSALLTGDIGTDQEAELIRLYDLPQITLYKAAHHGSAYSNSEAILKLLRPRLTVISCSEKNRYGHPAAAAVERILQTGSRIFYTKESGQITIKHDRKAGLAVAEYVKKKRTGIVF